MRDGTKVNIDESLIEEMNAHINESMLEVMIAHVMPQDV